LWYARQTVAHGWSRAVLGHQIESNLHERQGKALTNFHHTLPSPESDFVRQLLKDPYNFDFLSLADNVDERELERSLIAHMRNFLLELGRGFAFIGSQHHLEVCGKDYHLDLFFYHILLRCFIVIDLKVEEFKPEFAGKMNFYLSAVDDQYRGAHDGPSIGILLCKTKSNVIVEYALRDTTEPIGVGSYIIGKPLPAALRNALPSEEQLRTEFQKVVSHPRI
jgi:predicted nuclease of restriction endonuclease-like (RecB) superfamily